MKGEVTYSVCLPSVFITLYRLFTHRPAEGNETWLALNALLHMHEFGTVDAAGKGSSMHPSVDVTQSTKWARMNTTDTALRPGEGVGFPRDPCGSLIGTGSGV